MKNKTWVRLEKKAYCNWRQIVANHIFVDYLNKRTLEDTCKRIVRYRNIIIKLRDALRVDHKRMSKKYNFVFNPDLRTGDKTYGYKSIESINNNLDYISDRFCAEFRLSWLLEVPEKVAALQSNT
jgi:hypothetical protein